MQANLKRGVSKCEVVELIATREFALMRDLNDEMREFF